MIREVPSRRRGVPEGEPETLGSRGRCHRPGGVWDGVWRSGDLPNRERDRLTWSKRRRKSRRVADRPRGVRETPRSGGRGGPRELEAGGSAATRGCEGRKPGLCLDICGQPDV